MKKILFLSFLRLSLMACEKEIEVDLNAANPKLVVEASLNDQSDIATVQLSYTVNFSESNTLPPSTGASVIITDHEGGTWSLIETSPGIYQHMSLRGTIGHTYYLTIITTDNQSFSAESTIPVPVTLDSLSFIERQGPPGNGGDTISYFVIPRYFDPAGAQNNYRFVQILNGTVDHSILVNNDNIFDGRVNEQPIFSPDVEIHSGDTFTLEMMNIDKAVYDYFYSLSQSIGSGGPNSASVPANPVSNISNGALGYFSAFSSQKITVNVP